VQRNSLLLIGKARVPIIKFRENLSGLGLPCDISVGCVNGLHTVQWVRSQLQCYPLCVPLTVILKRFLEQRNMNEPVNGTSLQVSLAATLYRAHALRKMCASLGASSICFRRSDRLLSCRTRSVNKTVALTSPAGGIGGYLLINLVVSYVKRAYRQHSAEVAHAAGPTGDLGMLLLGFVEYYANRFDYNKYAVASAHPTGVKAKRTLTFTAGVPVSGSQGRKLESLLTQFHIRWIHPQVIRPRGTQPKATCIMGDGRSQRSRRPSISTDARAIWCHAVQTPLSKGCIGDGFGYGLSGMDVMRYVWTGSSTWQWRIHSSLIVTSAARRAR
jgi:hypothetical protein